MISRDLNGYKITNNTLQHDNLFIIYCFSNLSYHSDIILDNIN